MPDRLLGYVRKIREVLSDQEAPLRIELVEAGHLLWAAMSERDLWPPDLLKKARVILDQLLAGGTIHTSLAQMDDRTVRETAKDILELAADLDAARNQVLVT